MKYAGIIFLFVLFMLFMLPPSFAQDVTGTLAFTSSRAGNEDIWLYDLATGNTTNLTPGNSVRDMHAAWRNDGGKIAWTSGRKIWMMNPDGSGKVQLTSGSGFDRQPTWSPDGTEIAFSSDRSGREQIWTIRPDGSGLRQRTFVTGAFNGPRHPDWSHDGATMLLSFNAGNTIDIYTLDVASGIITLWPGSTEKSDHTTDWSADDSLIAYHHHETDPEHGGVSRIFLATRAGVPINRLTSCTLNRECDEYFSFGPDDQWGAFQRSMEEVPGNPDPACTDLFIVEVATGIETRLTLDGCTFFDGHPAWKPL